MPRRMLLRASIKQIEEGVAAISEGIETFLQNNREIIGPINDDGSSEIRNIPMSSVQKILREALSLNAAPAPALSFCICLSTSYA